VHDMGFVVAGYLLTGGALTAYVAALGVRARRARRLAAAIVSRRDVRSAAP
jgi:hypothetical protein